MVRANVGRRTLLTDDFSRLFPTWIYVKKAYLASEYLVKPGPPYLPGVVK